MTAPAAFQKPLTADNRDLIVSVSVGASIYPKHEKDSEPLLKAADAALFRAKVMGRRQLSVLTPELLQAAAKFTPSRHVPRARSRHHRRGDRTTGAASGTVTQLADHRSSVF